MTDLSGQLPPFNPAEPKPNSTLGPIADQNIKALPTWLPDAPNKDAALAKIADANTDGTYGVLNGSHPDMDDKRTAAAWPSDKLHQGGEGDGAVGPDGFARSGGTRRR